MGITAKEKAILSQAEFAPDDGIAAIARRAKQKPEAVAYALRKMRDSGLLTYRTFINVAALGFQDVAIFFTLATSDKSTREKVIKAFVESQQVAWLGALAGDFQYVAAFFSNELQEVSDFLASVGTAAGEVFGQRLIAPRIQFSRFPKKYLAQGSIKPPANLLSFTPVRPPVPIDETDRIILRILGNSSCDSLRELSRTSGLPLSTVDRRVRRLKESNVIYGYYEVNLSMLGYECWRIMLSCKSISTALRERLFAFCKRHPSVTFFVEVFGSWDYEVIVETTSSSEVMIISQEVAEVCGPSLGSLRVFNEINELKSSYFPEVFSPKR